METDSRKWIEWHPQEDDPLSPFIIKHVNQTTCMRGTKKERSEKQ